MRLISRMKIVARVIAIEEMGLVGRSTSGIGVGWRMARITIYISELLVCVLLAG